MPENAQKITSNPPSTEFYTAIQQNPYKWLVLNYGDSCAALWVWMRMYAHTYNHFPANLAAERGISERTINRRLNDLRKAGAVVKITRRSSNGRQCVYYRAVETPSQYRLDQAQDSEVQAVDNSKTQGPPPEPPMTNLSPLTGIKNLYSINSNTNPPPAVHSNHPPVVDKSGASDDDKRMFFDLLSDSYPDHKVPFGNPSYMQSCFAQFKICTEGMSFNQLEQFTGFLAHDIEIRKTHSPHWQIGNIPQFFGYFREQRWRMPVGAQVDFDDDFKACKRIVDAADRVRALESETGQRLSDARRFPYITRNALSEAISRSVNAIEGPTIGTTQARDWAQSE